MARNKVKKYETNPFVEGMSIKVKKKHVTIGKGNNVLLDQQTGEVSATNVVAVREVDDCQFIKLFTQNVSLMMGFNAAGNKAFGFLMWAVQRYAMRKDLVQLDDYTRKDFVADNNIVFSDRTMYQGLKQLEEAQIIAKALKPGFYFINPNFIFNGDRIRFVTEIRRKSAADKRREALEEAGQQRLFSDIEANDK